MGLELEEHADLIIKRTSKQRKSRTALQQINNSDHRLLLFNQVSLFINLTVSLSHSILGHKHGYKVRNLFAVLIFQLSLKRGIKKSTSTAKLQYKKYSYGLKRKIVSYR